MESVHALGDGRTVGVQWAGEWREHNEVMGTERLRCKGLIRIAADPSIDAASAEAAAAVADTDHQDTRILAAGQHSPRQYTGSLRIALGIKMGWNGGK